MEEADQADLSVWMGKPPEASSQEALPEGIVQEVDSSESAQEKSPAPSDPNSDEEINYDGTSAVKSPPRKSMADIENSDDGSLIEFVPQFQQKFYIDVPTMDEEEKRTYQHLPGHFTVKRILSEYRGDRFLVKLESREKKLVSLPASSPTSLGCLFPPARVLMVPQTDRQVTSEYFCRKSMITTLQFLGSPAFLHYYLHFGLHFHLTDHLLHEQRLIPPTSL